MVLGPLLFREIRKVGGRCSRAQPAEHQAEAPPPVPPLPGSLLCSWAGEGHVHWPQQWPPVPVTSLLCCPGQWPVWREQLGMESLQVVPASPVPGEAGKGGHILPETPAPLLCSSPPKEAPDSALEAHFFVICLLCIYLHTGQEIKCRENTDWRAEASSPPAAADAAPHEAPESLEHPDCPHKKLELQGKGK